MQCGDVRHLQERTNRHDDLGEVTRGHEKPMVAADAAKVPLAGAQGIRPSDVAKMLGTSRTIVCRTLPTVLPVETGECRPPRLPSVPEALAGKAEL